MLWRYLHNLSGCLIGDRDTMKASSVDKIPLKEDTASRTLVLLSMAAAAVGEQA